MLVSASSCVLFLCVCLREYGLSYLSLRTCIGLWTAFFCLLLVATDASSLVCYITRFTEEAFAALICIIFIYEALEKLIHLGVHYPVNKHNDLQKLTQYWQVSLSCRLQSRKPMIPVIFSSNFLQRDYICNLQSVLSSAFLAKTC